MNGAKSSLLMSPRSAPGGTSNSVFGGLSTAGMAEVHVFNITFVDIR